MKIFNTGLALLIAIIVTHNGCSSGSGGGGGLQDGQPVSSVSETVMTSGNSELRIPAGSFAEGMKATIAEGGVAAGTVSGTAVSPVTMLQFSAPAVAKGSFLLKLRPTVGIADAKGVSAMMKVEGDRIDIGSDMYDGWVPVAAHWDESTGSYEITLYGTAAKISMLLVKGAGTLVDMNDAAAFRAKGFVAGAPSAKKGEGGVVGWADRTWVLSCALVGADRDDYCDIVNNPAALAKWSMIRQAMLESGKMIQDELAFDDAKLEVYQGSDFERVFGSPPPGGDRDAFFNVITYVECGQSEDGSDFGVCWSARNGGIHISPQGLQQNSSVEDFKKLLAHELGHAAAAAYGPSVFSVANKSLRPYWITEGTADAIAAYSIGRDTRADNPRGARDWTVPLRNRDGDIPYRTSQFWGLAGFPFAGVEGDVGYLRQLFTKIEASGLKLDDSGYATVDAAFKQLLGFSLGDDFVHSVQIDLIGTPNPARESIALASSDLKGRVSIDRSSVLRPMSAVEYEIVLPETRSITVSSRSTEANPTQRIIVGNPPALSPVILSGGEKATLKSDRFLVRVVDSDIERADDVKQDVSIQIVGRSPFEGTWCIADSEGRAAGECIISSRFLGDMMQIKVDSVEGAISGRFKLPSCESDGSISGIVSDDGNLIPVVESSRPAGYQILFDKILMDADSSIMLSYLITSDGNVICSNTKALVRVSESPLEKIPSIDDVTIPKTTVWACAPTQNRVHCSCSTYEVSRDSEGRPHFGKGCVCRHEIFDDNRMIWNAKRWCVGGDNRDTTCHTNMCDVESGPSFTNRCGAFGDLLTSQDYLIGETIFGIPTPMESTCLTEFPWCQSQNYQLTAEEWDAKAASLDLLYSGVRAGCIQR